MLDRKAYMKEWHRKNYSANKDRILERQRRTRKKEREEAIELLEGKCFFCGRDDVTFVFHKKDGQPHRRDAFLLVRENPEPWALLCKFPCHEGVHWLMDVWGLSWEEIVEVYKANLRFEERKKLVTINFDIKELRQ